MRYFIYCRKSTDREDRQILSTEAQERLLTEYARSQGFQVVKLYVENQSAYKVGRPLFNEMLQRIEQGHASGILTYHLTRLARNSFDGGRIIYMMDEGAIAGIATMERAYTNNSDDKFIMQIHFAMAKKSSDDTSQFVARDIESKLLRGEYPGRVPPGYLNINREGRIAGAQADPDKEMLLRQLGRPLLREEIDPLVGPVVRQVFEAAASGNYSIAALRKHSYRLGLRTRATGRMMSQNGLVGLLTNPYYFGVIEHNGTIYDEELLRERTGNPEARIRHEPLVSRQLFQEVQAVVKGRSKPRQREHNFSFGGCLIHCGECGCPITAERQKGHVYYHCTKTRGYCGQRGWTREETLQDQFDQILGRLVLPQPFVELALGRLRDVHATEAQVVAVARRRLQGQINAAQQRVDALLQLKLSPGNREGELLSDSEFLEQKREIRKELDILNEQLAAVSQQAQAWFDDCERFLAFTQRLTATFAAGTPEDRRALIVLVCSNPTLVDQRVAAEYREPFATLAGLDVRGPEAGRPIEPGFSALGSENVLNSIRWRHLLTLIRTYRLPEEARRIAGL